MIVKFFLKIFLLIMLCFLCSCSSGSVAKKDVHTLAQSEYEKGCNYLNAEQLDAAEFYFQNAALLDSSFAPAYEGLARISLFRHQVNKAEFLIDKSLSLSPAWAPSLLVKAHIEIERGNYLSAIKKLEGMINTNRSDESMFYREKDLEEAYLLIIKSYLKTGQYQNVISYLDHALEKYPASSYLRETEAQLKHVISAVNLGSDNLKNIFLKNKITREETAFVIYEWFGHFFKNNTNHADLPKDINEKDKYFSAIRILSGYRIMPVYPDGLFRPQKEIKRAELVLILHKLFGLTSAEKPGFSHGTIKSCADVPEDAYYFEALQTLIANHIIVLNSDQRFYPDLWISGLEAVSWIYNSFLLIDNR
ncbi:MAG: S-layer homology domain-containing protein [Calditrichaceae bacterium]|nr:S-layer homology domain-containing protein [Calditrichaceae bacterium]MBN2709979.1 S-layer homology domain-containing protein [Calditrichaceae bacterium]RQV97318.1 MAG: hypothetical protein EH224_01875 [Calditrichota bacterium]